MNPYKKSYIILMNISTMLKDVFQFFKGYPINNNITNCCSSMVKSSYCLILIKNCICKQWFKLVQWFPRGRFFFKFTDGRRGTPSDGNSSLGLLARCAKNRSRQVSGKWYHPHKTKIDEKNQTFAILSRVRN
jgi:hypothetical protein